MKQDIFYEALNELADYLMRLDRGIKDAITHIRDNKTSEADQLLILILDGLKWSIDVLNHTKQIFVQNGLEINEDQIIIIFKDLETAFQNKDYLLIADILEYEILELLSSLKKDLTKIT